MEKVTTEKEESSILSNANSDRITDDNSNKRDYFKPLQNWVQPKNEVAEKEQPLKANSLGDGQEKRLPMFSSQRELFVPATSAESSKEAMINDNPSVPDKSDSIDLKNMWQKINLMDQKNQRRQEEKNKYSDLWKQQNVFDSKKLPTRVTSDISLSAWECKEEQEFEMQFKEWEKQFETWQKQNKDHPDRAGFVRYEEQWTEWRDRLLRRRDQVRKLRVQQQLLQKE